MLRSTRADPQGPYEDLGQLDTGGAAATGALLMGIISMMGRSRDY